MTMNTDVFLSHSHVDKEYADAICHYLEAAGIRCWMAPRDIRPSDDWAEAIISAMDQTKILVLIFSASSNSSPQVRREVERAVCKGLTVLPFRIQNVPLSKSLEYFISTQHWLDAMTGDRDEHLAELRQSVSLLLRRLRTPPPMAEPAWAAASPEVDIAPADLAAIELALARVIGPIAGHLTRRAMLAAPSQAQLVAALAQEIDDAGERQRFVASCHGPR
jgi:hypothetical protein